MSLCYFYAVCRGTCAYFCFVDVCSHNYDDCGRPQAVQTECQQLLAKAAEDYTVLENELHVTHAERDNLLRSMDGLSKEITQAEAQVHQLAQMQNERAELANRFSQLQLHCRQLEVRDA